MASKVWFITGTSKGFGRVWAEAALARGDQVAATARDVKTLQPLVERYGDRVAAIKLDVTDKPAVNAAIAEAHARFGRLDVVVNNAGYGLFGTGLLHRRGQRLPDHRALPRLQVGVGGLQPVARRRGRALRH